MALLTDLIEACDELLEPQAFADYAPNGVQVPGRTEVRSIVTGVSATAELIDAAAARGADLLLVHHGIFWKGDALALDPVRAGRLKALFAHDIALAAYHLPLDGHPGIGNNALLAKALGCVEFRPFGSHGGAAIGVAASFPDDGLPRTELAARVREACHGREPLVFAAGPDPVRTIGVISGAAGDHVVEAADAGLDAFLTGEPAERHMALARERGITFVAAGHHATETRGIRALGDHLADRFGIAHEFVDIWNPI